MINIILDNNTKEIKKLILALLKSKNAIRVLAQDYIKSYILVDNKINKSHKKILYIYTDKSSDQILSFANKTFASLSCEIL